ncbi:MAG: hypothetical protein V4549_11745 [Bacteroidota bacterium]
MRTSIKVLLLTVTSFLFVANVLRAQSWTPASPNIYFTGGNVGIGTTAPYGQLTVAGAGQASTSFSTSGSYLSSIVAGDVTGSTGSGGALLFAAGSGVWANNGVFAAIKSSVTNGIGPFGDIQFCTRTTANSSTTTLDSKMTILGGGNVGIGTTAPDRLLTVSGGNAGIYNTSPGLAFKNTASSNKMWDIGGYVNDFQINETNVATRLVVQAGGNVGIGTTNPLAKLHANNGSVLFDGTTGATPTSGAGTRMMWIPAKAAFRAGSTLGTEWNDASIGSYSVAFGSGTTASGSYSSAFGGGSNASGYLSSAFGTSTASGLQSTSFGSTTVASGEQSFASGFGTNASGKLSYAFGSSTVASGDYSSSFGISTTAQACASFVIGRYNIISGTTASWNVTDPLFVIGNGTSTSARSNALTVLKNGNVGIGTALVNNPNNYKLAVNGTIGAKAVKVEITSTTWPDFVFNKEYKLPTLKEIEQFIQQNGHLPEIPTAKEIETNGVDIGDLLKLQMKKIEELTLYVIELNKKIEAYEAK